MATATTTLDAPATPATSPQAPGASGPTPDTDLFTAAVSEAIPSSDPEAAPVTTDPAPSDPAPETIPAPDDAPADGTDTPPPTPEPAVEFDITVPLPGELTLGPDGQPSGNRAGNLDLAFPTQEARDAVRFHVKRSLELEQVQQDAEAGLEARATLAHLDAQPEQAMYILEQSQPTAAKAYVDNWITRNPVQAALAVQALGFVVQDPWQLEGKSAEQALADKAKLAEIAQRDALATGRQTYQQTRTAQRVEQTGSAALRALATTAKIDLQTPEGEYVAKQLATVFAQHLSQVPTATRAELLALPTVQDKLNIYQRLIGATPVAPAKPVAVRDKVGQFAAHAQTAQAAARLAPGQTRIPALRAEKFKRGTTLDDLP